MSLPVKIGVGAIGVTGVVGAGYLGSNYFLKSKQETFATKYSQAILDTSKDSAIWSTKLAILEVESSTPKNKYLIKAKAEKKVRNETNAKDLLRQGCKEIYEKPSTSKDDLEDFKSFCSLNNGDKIEEGKELASQEVDFDGHWNTFNSANRDNLYEGFKTIHSQKGSSSTENQWKKKMLEECKKISTDIFDGEIPNFTTFCTKNKTGTS